MKDEILALITVLRSTLYALEEIHSDHGLINSIYKQLNELEEKLTR